MCKTILTEDHLLAINQEISRIKMEIYEYEEVAQVHNKLVLDKIDEKSGESKKEEDEKKDTDDEKKADDAEVLTKSQEEPPKMLRSRLDILTEQIKELTGPNAKHSLSQASARKSDGSDPKRTSIEDSLSRAEDS